jgi:hypothetical protein
MMYEAIFQPSDKNAYNEEAGKIAGKKVAVYSSGIMADGPFKGQDCYYIPSSTVGFIPRSDLKELKSVSLVQWKQIHKRLGF